MSKVTVEQVARELGMKPGEIASIEDSPAGLVVSFPGGTAMVNVPKDAPDVEGKTGWMWLAVPPMKPGKVYQGEFPVYAQPVEEAEPEPGDEYPTSGSIEVVLAWVAGDLVRAREALEHEHGAPKPRVTLVEELEAIVEQATDAAASGDAAGIVPADESGAGA
jgi:hypothetical protein